MWVSPFRYLRIFAYLQLPAAFRSLSRLSSALSAKASSLCSSSLNLLSGLAWPASWLLLLLSDVLSLSRSFKRFLILVQYSVFKVQVFGCPLPAITGHNLFCPLITGKFSFPALLSFLFWQPPALPCRLQHSTIGRLSLNRRVRDGYACFP